MNCCFWVVVCVLCGLSLPLASQTAACSKLPSGHFPNTKISSAEDVAAGPYQIPKTGAMPSQSVTVPAICRVKGEVLPQIRFALWMPAQNWNGRLVALGSGGFGGYINEAELASMVAKGYAATANDTGHTGQGYEWMHDPTALLSWGHSATHDVVVPVKEILRSYYEKAPEYSYFQGCSTGGAQAMEEAEFFPDDFNGIVAGSPGMYYSHLMLSFLWGLKTTSEHATLSAQKLQLLHQAVLEKCDAEDAVKDELAENPLACHFDPKVLLCRANAKGTNDCLTEQEVRTADLIYQGPRNPRTGAELYPGFVPGSEAFSASAGDQTSTLSAWNGWNMIQGPLGKQYAVPLLQNMVFGEDWNWKTFDFDHDVQRLDDAVHAKIDAIDPDLRRFNEHRGKLIMTQGWADQFNAQTYPIEYRDQVISVFASHDGRQKATEAVDSFFRLFMAPGMGHCLGGPGPSKADALGAVRKWVETGIAPSRIIAEKVVLPTGASASPPMTRPWCPYPQVARYVGKGSTNDAGNFVCTLPSTDGSTRRMSRNDKAEKH